MGVGAGCIYTKPALINSRGYFRALFLFAKWRPIFLVASVGDAGIIMKEDTEVNLSGHKIELFQIEDYWSQYSLTKVTKIDLSNNLLTALDLFYGLEHISIFEGFSNLQTLILNNNPIEDIHPHCFKFLKSLRNLEINNSLLSKSSQFRFLKNVLSLEVVSIRDHRCMEMNLREFVLNVGPLPNLKVIDFSRMGIRGE